MDGKGNTNGSGRLTLLADAGGTKTSWVLTGGDEVLKYKASGINLAVMPKEAVLSAVLEAADMMGAENAAAVGKIRYYGAGVIDSRNILILDSVLKNVFPGAEAVYGSDLLAAAEAGLGDSCGIVCILGTGSNSGVYDGRKIVSNIRPGGYILGDEGSGSALGKMLLADYVKGMLPESISEKFASEPAGYLASFAPFVLSCRGDSYADGLVERNLRNFIERSVLPYGLDSYDIAVAGSVGTECRAELERLGGEYGLKFIRFVKNPVDVLATRMSEENE